MRDFHQLSSLIFEVKKSEIYYLKPRPTTSRNGYIFEQSKLSRNIERKPNNNYSCCVKPILTLKHCQMHFLLLSGASRQQKSTRALTRTRKCISIGLWRQLLDLQVSGAKFCFILIIHDPNTNETAIMFVYNLLPSVTVPFDFV